jgi:catechol 2,3-dioxygenase-like lactoylglutathione lyase family enzyme
MPTVSIRYIVDDVDYAIRFYVDHLGFQEVMHPAPAFAMLARDELRLVLSKPGGGPGGGAALPDGTLPTPGGWNRFAIEVEDVSALLATLTSAGVRARSDVIEGVGGRQVIIDDPSGNPIELFQPTIPEAKLAHEGR